MQRPIRILLTSLAVAGLLSVLPACGSDDSTEGAACFDHSGCDRGEFCSLDGRCEAKECETAGDCDGGINLVCLQDIGMCGSAECTPGAAPGTEGACLAGFECKLGSCMPISTGGDDTVGGDTKPTPDAAEEVTEPVFVEACTDCVDDSECGEGKSCEPIAPGKACLASCESDDECELGWVCYEQTNEGKFCVPISYDCSYDCLRTGCADGEVCDQDRNSETLGQCVPILAECGECAYDWECGEGSFCVTTPSAMRFCMPECSASACPSWATCVEKPFGMACVPNNANCCGEECAEVCDPPCAGARPVCHGGVCVQCAEDADCQGTDQTCNPTSFTCEGGCADQPGTPYEFEGNCVQCLEDSHCGDGACDPATHVCTGGDPCNGMCSGDYPACAVINGVPSCVPCTEDAHCNGGTCDVATYACSNAGAVNCNQDCVLNDCPQSTTFDLQCDPESGCCYDTAGNCDNVQAYCNEASGSTCTSVFDIFMGGLGGAIPGMPAGTEFTGGFCTCAGLLDMPLRCQLFPDSEECQAFPSCYEGVNCLPIGDLMPILSALMGGGGGPALIPGMEDANFCSGFSLGDIF